MFSKAGAGLLSEVLTVIGGGGLCNYWRVGSVKSSNTEIIRRFAPKLDDFVSTAR